VKIEVFFGHDSMGTARNDGDKLFYAGADPDAVQNLVESIALQTSGKTGADLLTYIVKRLDGRVRAKEL
jgi:hypothetical protein